MSASSDLRATAGRATVSTAALAVAAISLAPLLVVASRAFGAPWHEVTAYLLRPRMGELVGHTLALVGVTVPATVVLGIGCAWLVERTDVPAPSLWRILLTAPLAVPAFVSSYAWTSAVPGMEGLGGAALVTTLAYLPFVLLPVAAVLRDLDLADEEVARSLGLGPRAAVLRTVLPRLRPAASGGALLVALHLLAEFGVLEMMRYPTVTTAILTQYSMGFSNDEGAMLAMVLVVMCLALLGLEMLLRGPARTARLGRGVHQRAGRSALGPWRWPATLLLAVVVLLPYVAGSLVCLATGWDLVAFLPTTPLRVAANRVNIAEAILAESGGDDGSRRRLTLYRDLLAEVDDPNHAGGRIRRQILGFDPARASLIELHGDLASARGVAVLVPGVNTTMEGSAANAATARRFVTGSEGDVAMITYLGGPFPQVHNPLAVLLDAADPDKAQDMAPRLVAFSEDVERTVKERRASMLSPGGVRYDRKTVSGRHIEFVYTPLANGGLLGMHRDITELKDREQAVEQARRQRRQGAPDRPRHRPCRRPSGAGSPGPDRSCRPWSGSSGCRTRPRRPARHGARSRAACRRSGRSTT